MAENAILYKLKNDFIQLDVTNIGASIVSLKVKDKNKQWQDVVLGLNDVNDYLTENDPSFGSSVGRYANRIKDGQFTLEGVSYQLDQNDGMNCLHGGFNRFSTRIWQLEEVNDTCLTLKLFSPDGDQGFPGNLTIFATFELKNQSVVVCYSGISDQKTVFNPTNHTYFNLNGHQNGTILTHHLKLPCHYFMPLANDSVPLGEKKEVIDTPMDFLTSRSITSRFDLDNQQLSLASGYDHYFLLDEPNDPIEIYSPITGISLSINTDLPGFQFYTANFFDHFQGKSGATYNSQDAFCIETQFCPNGINNPEIVAKGIIEKDQIFKSETIWTFDMKEIN